MEQSNYILKRPSFQEAATGPPLKRRRKLSDERPDQRIYSPKPTRPYASQFLDSRSVARLGSWLESVDDPLESGYLPPRFCHSAPAIMGRKEKEREYVPPRSSSSSYAGSMGPPLSPYYPEGPLYSEARYAMQAPPSSRTSGSRASSASQSTNSSNLVQDPNYRNRNLELNGIYAQDLNPYSTDPLPPGPGALVSRARQQRDSPEPSIDSVRRNRKLSEMTKGAMETGVEDYIQQNLFPGHDQTGRDPLDRSLRNPMNRSCVPGSHPVHKVSTPVPDMMYGYERQAFSESQRVYMAAHGNGTTGVANTAGLLFPFFVVEVKGDSPRGNSSSLYVATNQCLGGSATCISIMEHLNEQLRAAARVSGSPVRQTDSASWSIAVSNSEARLYISWKGEDLKYYTRGVESFLLQRPDDYLLFRRMIRNILDWGRNERLREIRGCLDRLVDEAQHETSQRAKSRPPPSSDSSSSSSKRRGGGSERSSRR